MIVVYFFETTESIPEGLGFDAYGPLHIGWLVFLAAMLAAVSLWYKRTSDRQRSRILMGLALTIFIGEFVRDGIFAIGGNFTVDALPLHLCGINIFIILAYAIRPSEVLAEYLYAVCMPGALAALLFPSWTAMPITSFSHIYSFMVHLWLFMFPFLLLVGGFKPQFKRLWRSLPYAIPVVIFVYIFNKIFDTDFMFLNGGGEGNPIAFFASKLGNPLYIITIPFLIAIVWSAMYGIPYLFGKLCASRKAKTSAAEASL